MTKIQENWKHKLVNCCLLLFRILSDSSWQTVCCIKTGLQMSIKLVDKVFDTYCSCQKQETQIEIKPRKNAQHRT